MIEHSQVLIAIFWPIVIGEIGVAAPRSSWANPVGDAISGQGIVIPANIPLIRIGPEKPPLDILAQATVACLAWTYEAFINAQIALFAFFILGRVSWQIEGFSCLSMRFFYKGQSFIEVRAQTVKTNPEG